MLLRFRFLIVLVIICLGILFPSIVHAQTYFYRWQAGLTYNCGPYLSGIGVVFSSQSIEYDLPTGASYNINYTTNGVVNLSGPFGGLPTGVGTQVFDALSMDSPAYPTTFAVTLETIVGGSVVYSSTMLATCTADSTGTPVTLTNIDLSGGGAAQLAFTDGRLNPQPYAPVVLYCSGNVLNAFAVSGNVGALAWSHEFDSEPTPDADSVVESGGGSWLIHFANGRYGIQAAQTDGKSYLFIFDGCPNIGIPETYVTDPISGGFVRSD